MPKYKPSFVLLSLSYSYLNSARCASSGQSCLDGNIVHRAILLLKMCVLCHEPKCVVMDQNI